MKLTEHERQTMIEDYYNNHCEGCKYFGEKTGYESNHQDLHLCHNEESIFKACVSSATRCNKFERRGE